MIRDLFFLDPQVTFLNHGSFGACPRPVFENYQAWQRQLEHQPVRFLGVELDHYMYEARQVLAKYLHSPVSDLVYIPNATHGVNIVAQSLDLQPGEEILSTDQEYGACDLAWKFVCQRSGAFYRQQQISLPVKSPEAIAEQLWQGVTPHTRLIFLSHITSPTAITLPVRLVSERARAAGILTFIDGAHAPGQINLDLTAIQPDFYTGNCHKWMMSPKGAGFLYARPDVQHLIKPLIVSWGYQSYFNSPHESNFIDFLQWTGTRDPAAYLSVPSAIKFMHEYGWENIRQYCHQLLHGAIEKLCSLTGLSPLCPPDSDFYYQMATVPIPYARNISELKDTLYNEYRIEIPCIEWNNRHFIRISVQGYNSQADIDILIGALTNLLPTFME
jgi:isopenicillin-N epimerase